MAATLRNSAAWSIRESLLTLTAADGHVLVYRVRPSIYPSLTARTPTPPLRIAGAWIADFRPDSRPVTFYDRAGTVIAAWPNGPC